MYQYTGEVITQAADPSGKDSSVFVRATVSIIPNTDCDIQLKVFN